ncbi:C-type lectin domain family 4 member F-like isoform X2 [Oncorhynchus tshawytscha]|uniref:C-type lectin domain family 4 member F-like isoform X2 n=1 Tax=Oncorhynchus tshawytscha TaxID=74940 RepID=UPI001C3C7605|nr:C-type lectin domain family 4 member F-like isoform X2 [Oncorhynchus tshawytscha]
MRRGLIIPFTAMVQWASPKETGNPYGHRATELTSQVPECLRRHYILLLCVVVVGCTVAVISLFAQKNYQIAQRQQSNIEPSAAEREEMKSLKSEDYGVLLNMILKQEGWRYINSSLYYISTETKSWGESRPYCQRKGLDLVTINSKDEEDFLLDVVRAKKLDVVWIGFSPNNTKEISTRVKRGAGPEEDAQEEDCAKLMVYETPAVKEVTGRQCGTQKYCICEKYLDVKYNVSKRNR